MGAVGEVSSRGEIVMERGMEEAQSRGEIGVERGVGEASARGEREGVEATDEAVAEIGSRGEDDVEAVPEGGVEGGARAETETVPATGPETAMLQVPPAGTVAYRPGMTLEDMELEVIRAVLNTVDWNRRRAAEILGIGERTLYRKVRKYKLDKEMEQGSRPLPGR